MIKQVGVSVSVFVAIIALAFLIIALSGLLWMGFDFFMTQIFNTAS